MAGWWQQMRLTPPWGCQVWVEKLLDILGVEGTQILGVERQGLSKGGTSVGDNAIDSTFQSWYILQWISVTWRLATPLFFLS